MKWVVLSVQYGKLYICKRYVKIVHVLKKVSGQNDLFLFSSYGHEQVSVVSRLQKDYTKQEYDELVKSHVRQLKEKLCVS